MTEEANPWWTEFLSCRPVEAFAPIHRRWRPAGPLSRAGGADSPALGARNTRAGRYQRFPDDGPDVGESAASARGCIHRWVAAGARCPASAGNLRAHSQEHRGSEDHGPLHRDRSNDEAARIPGRILGILDAAPGD